MEPPPKLTSLLGDDGLWRNLRYPLFCWNYEICGTSDEMLLEDGSQKDLCVGLFLSLHVKECPLIIALVC
jgi:hypothetical protein